MYSVFGKKNFSTWLTVVGLLLLAVWYYKLASEAKFIQDDAFTSLRYVQNFVDGNGLVFNIGERVEGYTNFLWVLLLSAVSFLAHALNLNPNLPLVAQFLSTLFGVLILVSTYLLAKKIIVKNYSGSIISSLLALSAPAMVLFTTPFIYWSVSGMETPLFVSLTLLSVYHFIDYEEQGKRNAFVIVSVLNSFLRPEGMFFFILLMSFKLIKNFFSAEEFKLGKKIKSSFDSSIKKSLIIYAVPVIAYIIFRLLNYGYPFPNTFYAKTEFTIQFLSRGWNYYINFLEEYLLFGLFYVPVLIQLMRSKTNTKENILIGFALVYTITIIVIGGDVLPVNRFFLTIMPMLFILFINSTTELIEEFLNGKVNLFAKYSMVIILLAYSVLNYQRNLPVMMEKRAYEIGLVSKMKIYAELLNTVRKDKIKIKSKNKIKTTSVAMSTIGAFSFYSGARVIDLVGLTDEYVAHNPIEVEGIDDELPVIWKERHYNAGYVLSEKPDYIIFPAGAKPSAFAECAIYVQEEFRKNYYMQLFYSKELNQLLPVFTRLENVRSDSADCGSGFVKHYIEANNLFLGMIKSGDKSLIRKINNELDAVFLKCSVRIPEVKTLKGMTFYHAGNYIIAEKYLRDAAEADSTNAIARIYLKNIYFSQGKIEEAQKLIPEILRFSPGAIPGFEQNIYTGRN
ncbi:MAG: tetratricopeptide repeat protein [Stygiobacter sp.]|nr:MAG: tetratricopeptide repeat protein [Stygiobacter sp.]